ncbi:MAG: glycosyltransferase family 4 protein [Candidatus Thermoplasmatota archaeon]|nr:glycosyltransferase family 4 protein [Candidatus Thermoplasmatota archaeon]
MKIAVIGWELPPAFSGGLGVHTINLFGRLAAIMNIDVYVPAMKRLGRNYPFNVVPVRLQRGVIGNPYEIEGFPDFREAVDDYNVRVFERFDPHGVSLVHCHDWITFRAGEMIREKYGIPLVVTFHSTERDRSGNFNPQADIMSLEKEGAKAADRIIAVSKFTRDEIIRDYGADPDKITVVHNGVDNEHYTMRPRTYEPTNRVLYLGRVTTQKGPRFFMEAAELVSQRMPDVRFVVAGTGDQYNEVRRLASELGISGKTDFTGFVSFRKSVDIYRSSDVFVLPAVSEPFGMTVIESMILGTPAIISKTTGVGEALRNVLRVDYWDTELIADYVESMLMFRSMRRIMGTMGQQEASRFTWEKAALDTMGVYLSI